jgi:hypothetical protein
VTEIGRPDSGGHDEVVVAILKEAAADPPGNDSPALAWVPQNYLRLVTEKRAVTCGNAEKPSDGRVTRLG